MKVNKKIADYLNESNSSSLDEAKVGKKKAREYEGVIDKIEDQLENSKQALEKAKSGKNPPSEQITGPLYKISMMVDNELKKLK